MDTTNTMSARLTPVDLNISSDIIQRLQKEFGNALSNYQSCMQQYKLDPDDIKLRQSLMESQKQIVGVSVKQKMFVKQFREKSQVTPNAPLSENKVAVLKGIGTGGRTGSSGTSDGGCNHHHHHCTPPNSEDEHSDLSRSLSSGSGISICTESISCPSSVSNTPLSSRPSSPNASNSRCNPPVFPSEVMEQEEFLKGFGLITHESLKTKSETKRVERRRRTTANPKYNGHGFVDLSHISRRTRRLEEPDCGGNSPKRITLISGVICKHSQPKCIICEQVGCNLTCENCESQLHVDCIRVSGSRAPAPTRLNQCPRCIMAMHESRRLQGFNSNTDDIKFQKPLIPTTPIIPLNMKKKVLGSSSPDSEATVKTDTKSSTKTSKITKKMIAAGISVKYKSVANKTAGGSLGKTSVLSGKTSSVPTKKGGSNGGGGGGGGGVKVAAVTESSGSLCKIDLIGKPVLTSPFKTLSALTSKGGAMGNTAKNLQANKLGGVGVGSSFTNPTQAPHGGNLMNGTQSIKNMQPMKKKSKINGVKAKTLSMTGNQHQSNNSNNGSSPNHSNHSTQQQKTLKPKTSPLNNLNSNGNINSPKQKLSIKSSSRLPKFNADQHLSMQRTILAMTAAAKSVMSSNGLRVLPVSLGAELKMNNSNNNSEQEQTTPNNNTTPTTTPPPPTTTTTTTPKKFNADVVCSSLTPFTTTTPPLPPVPLITNSFNTSNDSPSPPRLIPVNSSNNINSSNSLLPLPIPLSGCGFNNYGETLLKDTQ